MRSWRNNHRGLTLIEVMVALLVLSVGLVGIAALNVTSVGAAHSAYYRSLASFIAIDGEERLWAQLGLSGSGTLSEADVTGEDGIQADWRETWAGYMPDLQLNMVPVAGASTVWMDVNITVEWAEGRFEGATTERFDYRARTLRGAP